MPKIISYKLKLIDGMRFMAVFSYKILLIIFLKGFRKLNAKTDMIIKHVKNVKLNEKF